MADQQQQQQQQQSSTTATASDSVMSTVASLYPFRPPPATATDLVWATITLLIIWGVISLYLMWKLKASKGDEYVSRVVSFLHAAVSVILCIWCLTQRYDEHLVAMGVRYASSSSNQEAAMTSQKSGSSNIKTGGGDADNNNNHFYYSSSSVVSGFVLCHANQARKDLFSTTTTAEESKLAFKSMVRSAGGSAASNVDTFLSSGGGCPDGLILGGDDGRQETGNKAATIQNGNIVSVYQDAPTHYLSSSSALSPLALRKQAHYRQLAVDSTSSPFSRFYSYFTIFGCFPSTSLPSEQLTLLVSATYFTVDLVGIYAGSYYDRLFVLHHIVSMATCYGTAFLGARAPIDAVWALANTMSSLVSFKTGSGGMYNDELLVSSSCTASSCLQKAATKKGSSIDNNKGALVVDTTTSPSPPIINLTPTVGDGASADSLFREWSKLRAEKSKSANAHEKSSASSDDSSSSSFWGYPALASGMELVLVVLLLEGANPLMHLRWILIMDYNKKRRGQLKNNSNSNGSASSRTNSSSAQLKPNFEDADVSCSDTNNNIVDSSKNTATDGGRGGVGFIRGSNGNVYIRTVPFENTCPLCCPSPELSKSPTTTTGSTNTGSDQQYLQLVGLANRVVDNPSTYTIEQQHPSSSAPATPLDGSQHQSMMDGEVVYRQQHIGTNNNNGSMAMLNRDRQNNNTTTTLNSRQSSQYNNKKMNTVSVRQFSNAVVGIGAVDSNEVTQHTTTNATPPLSPAAPPYRIQMSPATFMLSSPRRSHHNNDDNGNNNNEEEMSQMQLPPHAIGRSLVDSLNVTRGGGNSNNTSSTQLPHSNNNNAAEGGGGHGRQASTTDTLLASLSVPTASAFKEVTFLKSEDMEEERGNSQQQQPKTTTTSPTFARRSQSPSTNDPADDMIAVTFFPEPVTLNTTFDGKANSLVVSPITRVGNNNSNNTEQPPAPQLVTFCTCCTSYFLYQGAQSNNNNNTTSNPSDTSGNFSRGMVKGKQQHGAAVDVVHLKRIYPRQTLIMDPGSSQQPSTAVASPVTSQPTTNTNLASRTHSFSSHTAGGDAAAATDVNTQEEHNRTCNFVNAHSSNNNGSPHQSSSPFGASSTLSHRRAIGTEGMVLPSPTTIANTLNPIKKLLPASWGEKLSELGDKIAQHQRKAAHMFDSHVMLFSSVPTNRYFSDDSIAAAGYDPLWVVEHAADVVLEAMEEVEAALYIPPAIPHVVLALRRPPVRENRLFAFIDAIFVPIFVALRLVFGIHILFKFGRCPTTVTAILLLGIGFYILSAQFIVDVIRKNKRRELWL